MTPKSDLLFQLRFEGLPDPVREYKFALPRKWRFDFCWPEIKLAVEYEGIFSDKSRHRTIGGFFKDAEKYLNAQMMGWTVMRVTAKDVRSGLASLAIATLYRRLKSEGERNV